MAASEANKQGTGFVLVHYAATPAFQPLPLTAPVVYLGRLATNDVVLASDNVSRRHAKLIVTDLGVTAHDLDSHNGIFLNGKKVRSAPVAPGDKLYVGDVCLELQSSAAAALVEETHSTHSDISDEAEPRARSLAALTRVAVTCAGTDDTWATELMELCRELVDASVAAFVEQSIDGDLDAPIVLTPTGDKRGAGAVNFELVQEVVQTGAAVFNRPGKASPDGVMVAPIRLSDGVVAGVIYLSCRSATMSFTEVEFETLQIVGLLTGMRVERERRPVETTNVNAGELALAQSRLAVVEEQLADEAKLLSTTTARLHALEAENLGLRQQADLDKQSASRAISDRERDTNAKLEAAVVEGKKHQRDAREAAKQLEAASAARAAAERERDELQRQVEAQGDVGGALDDARQQLSAERERAAGVQGALDALRTELETLRASLDTLRDDRDGLRGELDVMRGEALALRDERDILQAKATAAEVSAAEAQGAKEMAAKHDALRAALRTSVLPTIVDHVEAVANGDAPTTPTTRSVTVTYVALADLDAWCERAAPEAIKAHLDAFCAAVSARAQANGGRVDQVIGHGHVLVFSAEPAGAHAAVRCALEIGAIVDADAAGREATDAPSVVAGLHTGAAVAGFFGDADAVSYVEAGLPIVIARAAVDFAPKGAQGAKGVLVSEPVRALLASDPGFRITRLDPSWIRGVNAPVQLALVDLDGGVR